MKKTRLAAAALAVTVLSGAVPFDGYPLSGNIITAQADDQVIRDGIKYNLLEDRAEVAGCTEDIGADVVIPDTVEGLPVTMIRSLKSEGLESVVIPDSVITIAEGAFANNKNLVSVTFGKNVQFINQEAFSGCEALKSVKLPDNALLEMGVWAFNECTALEEVDLGKGLASIGARAFRNCSALKKVNFGNVEQIGKGAFSGCEALTDIVLPDSVLLIDESAFSDCTGLKTVDMGSSVRTIKQEAFLRCFSLESVKFSEALDTIDRDAFYNCTKLKEIKLNDGVTTIEFGAFGMIDDLKIQLPATLEKISEYAFSSSNDVTVMGYDDTLAEEYVNENNEKAGANKITFESMGPVPYTLGDVNNDGKTDANDATLVLVNYSLLSTSMPIELTKLQQKAADVNEDTKIDSSDATMILQYYTFLSTGGDLTIMEFFATPE